MLYVKFLIGSLAAALLLGGCTKETEQKGTDPVTPDADDARREVMMTLKNKLSVKPVSSKAETPIATAAENTISTLDVYVFGATQENGDYTFLERFAYRADANDKLPQGATELQLNTNDADGSETTALLKLKKGLFVKLYCIANDTTLVDPADGKAVKPADFTPITFTEGEDGNPKLATEGVPQESSFTTWHTRLLTADAKTDTLATPLAMAGAYTTPIDLTSLDNAARLQVGFRLTRLAARFDINNKAGDSRFTIETVSMVNARRASGFFPIRVYGDLPKAQPDQLITYPAHAFYGDNANNGLCTGAFYAYPSPKEDKAFIILNGKYKVNETEMKKVSYQIPFTQQTADGNATWFDIANNHRYTINITQANAYHLDANILVADWADDGTIEYTPENKPGEIVVTIPEAFKGDSEYDEETKTVNMSLVDGSSITLSTISNAAIDLTKIYAGGINSKLYDWMNIADPVTSIDPNGRIHYTYTVTLKPGYTTGRYPRTTLRFHSLADGSEKILYIEALAAPKPIETVQPPKAPNGTSDNPNSFDPELMEANVYRITGSRAQVKITCPDGVDIESKPNWLDVTQASQTGADTVFDLVLNNRDIDVTGNQGTIVFNNKKKPELKVNVTVSLLEASVTPSYDAIGTDNTHTPSPDAGITPDDVEMVIKKDNAVTVKTNSLDGVAVKIDYPEGSPEWLTYEGAVSTKATTPGNIMNKTQDITFKPVESKLTGAKKATVTLNNNIGGKDYVFTMTPEMQAPTALKGATASVPVQDFLKTDTKTITIYQLPGENATKSQMQIAVTSLGGSALAIEGNAATITPAENTANEANYILKPTLPEGTDKATLTLHAKNYTDRTKMTDYAVSVLRSDLTGDTKASLTAVKDQSVTFKASSHEGFTIDNAAIQWQPDGESGGSRWFNIKETAVEAGTNKIVTAIATAVNNTMLVRPATVTLKNKIVDGGDLKVVIAPVYAAPTIKLEGTPAPTQNAITAANATASTLKLYRVANSQIKIKATAIGGSTITDAAGVTVTGGNTYNTENVYTVVLNNGATAGSFKIINKSDPTKIQTVTVQAPVTFNTAPAASKNLDVIASRYVDNSANFPEGFTVSVNWNGATANWFTLNKTDFTGGNQSIRATMKNQSGMSIKAATVTLKNKIQGGEDKTYTITPVFQAPALSYANGNVPTQNSMSGNTINLYQVTSSRVQVKASVLGGSYVKSKSSNITVSGGNNNNTDNTYTVTWVSGGDGWFDIANKHDANKTATRITVKALATTITSSDVSLNVIENNTANININTPLDATVSIVNWNGSGTWFKLVSTTVAAGNNKTISVQTLPNANLTNLSKIGNVTVRIATTAAGGTYKDISIKPVFPALKVEEKSATANKLNSNTISMHTVPTDANTHSTITLRATIPTGTSISVSNGLKVNTATSSTALYMDYIIEVVYNTSQKSGTVTFTNNGDSKKTTYNVTISSTAAYPGSTEPCFEVGNFWVGPVSYKTGDMNQVLSSCPSGWRAPSNDEYISFANNNLEQVKVAFPYQSDRTYAGKTLYVSSTVEGSGRNVMLVTPSGEYLTGKGNGYWNNYIRPTVLRCIKAK